MDTIYDIIKENEQNYTDPLINMIKYIFII